MTPRERSILTVTCYGHFISHFNMLVFPAVLLPLTARLGMEMGPTLALSFWMYLLFGITALPWGLLGDRLGSRPLLLLFYFGAGLCGLLAAMNTTNPFMFSLCLAGIGLFSGIYHPVGLGWIAREFKNTSQGMAYNGMFGNLGLATAPILAGSVNYFWGVEAVYGVLGVVNASGLILLYFVRNGHSTKQERREKKPQTQGNLKPFLVLLVAMMLGGVVYRATTVTLPAYFEMQNQSLYQSFLSVFGQLGSPNVFATLVTSFIYLVGMAGQYYGGRVGQSVDLGKGYLIFHLITIPTVIAMAVTSNMPLIIFAMVHSFFLLGMQPLENTLVARLSPPQFHSSAYGLKFILTFGVGALSVSMVSIIKESFGLSSVYFALALVSTTLVSAILLLNHYRKSLNSVAG
ncbi:arabinose efflux permease family protein [Desulfocapsa sulfexigens DSM 10523]|uniref:Arabinose efflux permease family protein n=1 Tax=Desulfocapsa sulfexigens (strain DSM 10523 / SB164P1) TaxID=1167006 RepID=M1PHE7_DESSD|nr:MFS transporter [Desulfocapsa sulfexigens]AGF79025.1 arabinose efflux permease family protein [Desulfocapsa sulfexigens DSM 10523]